LLFDFINLAGVQLHLCKKILQIPFLEYFVFITGFGGNLFAALSLGGNNTITFNQISFVMLTANIFVVCLQKFMELKRNNRKNRRKTLP